MMIQPDFNTQCATATIKSVILNIDNDISSHLNTFTWFKINKNLENVSIGLFKKRFLDFDENKQIELNIMLWFLKKELESLKEKDTRFVSILNGVKMGIFIISNTGNKALQRIIKFVKMLYLNGCKIFIFFQKRSKQIRKKFEEFKQQTLEIVDKTIFTNPDKLILWFELDPSDPQALSRILSEISFSLYIYLKPHICRNKYEPIFL